MWIVVCYLALHPYWLEANWYVYLGKNAAGCRLPLHKFGSGHVSEY